MKKIIFVSILFFVAFLAGTYFIQKTDTYKIQKEIANEIIRFHVRANSDSEEDKQLKLLVKDEIVLFLQNKLSNASHLDEARKI